MNVAELWKQAIEEEIDSLNCNYAWDNVLKPSYCSVVGSGWVFKIEPKRNGSIKQYKTRLIVKEFF